MGTNNIHPSIFSHFISTFGHRSFLSSLIAFFGYLLLLPALKIAGRHSALFAARWLLFCPSQFPPSTNENETSLASQPF
jgi:hypothetical protein